MISYLYMVTVLTDSYPYTIYHYLQAVQQCDSRRVSGPADGDIHWQCALQPTIHLREPVRHGHAQLSL